MLCPFQVAADVVCVGFGGGGVVGCQGVVCFFMRLVPSYAEEQFSGSVVGG